MLYLTFHSKSIQIPRTFLWPFSETFGLTYSPLNSAKLNCSSEVTLKVWGPAVPLFFPSLGFHWLCKFIFIIEGGISLYCTRFFWKKTNRIWMNTPSSIYGVSLLLFCLFPKVTKRYLWPCCSSKSYKLNSSSFFDGPKFRKFYVALKYTNGSRRLPYFRE